MNFGKLFAAAVFASHRRVFGGVPLASLSNKARRQLTSHKSYSSTARIYPHNGERERARRLRFKEKHGHFA